jgi:hypothetical protein
MNGIGAISPSTALRIITPVAKSDDGGSFRHNDSDAPRKAYATFASRSRSQSFAGNSAPFLAQMIANDNGETIANSAGALAYDAMRHCLTDLAPGFLISRAV